MSVGWQGPARVVQRIGGRATDSIDDAAAFTGLPAPYHLVYYSSLAFEGRLHAMLNSWRA